MEKEKEGGENEKYPHPLNSSLHPLFKNQEYATLKINKTKRMMNSLFIILPPREKSIMKEK